MSVMFLWEIFPGVLLALLALYITYWIYISKNHYWVDKNIPFERPFPIWFAFLLFLNKKSLFCLEQELYQRKGKVFGAYFGTKPFLNVADPDLLKLILIKDFNVFPSRRLFETGTPILDNQVSIIADVHKWRNIRNTITPAFSSGKLKSMIPIISDCANISKKNFEKSAKTGEMVNCKKFYGHFTLDVIANIAFGTRLDSHNDPSNKFVANASKFFGNEIDVKSIMAFAFPKFSKVFGVSIFPLDSMDFFRKTSDFIIKRRKENNEVRSDFLQIMIDSQKVEHEGPEKDILQSCQTESAKKTLVEQIKREPLTKDEALAQCVLFFLGGFDTIRTTLTMISYYLALNPDIQDKIIEEVDRVWENRDTLDFESLNKAKYIEAAIDETLRICPNQFRIERMAHKDYQLGDTGIPIKKGMIVSIPVYAMHHDPEFFPEPDEFKPERFFSKDDSEVKPYTYLPFGAGPRNCVAMRFALLEIKICLIHILKSVKFEVSSETKIPVEFFKFTPSMQPKEVLLKVTARL